MYVALELPAITSFRHGLQEPRRVDLPDAASFITAGHYHTVALTTAGELWTWGRNSAGQLGLGSSAPSKDTHTPQKVTALAGITSPLNASTVCD